MILGPLKSSQAGNRLQAKHCVRSANVPASPHHQKPVESSPSRPPRGTLSPTSTHQGSRGSQHQDWWPSGSYDSELSGHKSSIPKRLHLTRSESQRIHLLHPGTPLLIPTRCTPWSRPPRAGGYTWGSSASCQKPPYLQPRGPSVVLCAAPPHTRSSYTTLVCTVRFTTDRARLPYGSSSPKLILDSSPASDPEEGEGSRLRKPIIVSLIYNNCLFSSVSNLQ